MTDHAFCARLRHERERRGIALASIADRTKIAPALLVALERGDVTRWPGGIYRRSFIRAYAQAVGLDPNEVVREFLEAFPDPAEAALTTGEANEAPHPGAGSVSARAQLRVRIDHPPQLCRGGTLLSDVRQRLGALAADLAVLILITAGFSVALNDFWMPLAVAMIGYYSGGILIFGNTPGICLFAALTSAEAVRTDAPHASAGAPSAT